MLQQGLGHVRPNRKLSQKDRNFQELKICGHGTILALTNNRKPRTACLIQPTVLGSLVIGSKHCFTKLLQCSFYNGGETQTSAVMAATASTMRPRMMRYTPKTLKLWRLT